MYLSWVCKKMLNYPKIYWRTWFNGYARLVAAHTTASDIFTWSIISETSGNKMIINTMLQSVPSLWSP